MASVFLKRLEEKIQKENLWFFILLLLLKKDRYGYELRGLINEKFGFWSGNVTAYRVLYSLERNGYIKSKYKGRRNYYTIAPTGKKLVKKAIKYLEELVRKATISYTY